MSKVPTIMTIHDIDFDKVREDIQSKLEAKKEEYENINELFSYWRNESNLLNNKIEATISSEFNRIEYEYEVLQDQVECDHSGVRFHESVGHTHGGEHKETYCTECGYVFDSYID